MNADRHTPADAWSSERFVPSTTVVELS